MSEADKQKNGKGPLLVVDGHSLAFRAYYALPVESFTTSKGEATNAVWGFAIMLSEVIAAEQPTRMAVAFDMAGGTFRNEMLSGYKGTRQAAPEELIDQLPKLQHFLETLGVTYIEKQGYEGDDIIGTLATMGEEAGYRTLVLSGDRDAFQLADESVTVLFPGYHFRQLKRMTPEAIEEKYHVGPRLYPDLAALRGEQSDNIPGVPGVGDAYAARWLNEYGSLEGVLASADAIKGKKGQALRDSIEQVRLNRRVNALVRDLDLGVQVEDLTFGKIHTDEVNALFNQLEFGSHTRNKILKGFNCVEGYDDSTGTGQDAGASEEMEFELPSLDPVKDAEAFTAWCESHLPTVEDSRTMAEAMPDSGPVITAAGDGVKAAQEQAVACPDLAENSWYLYAEGDDKPGAAKMERLVILAPDSHAVMLDAQAVADDMLQAVQQAITARIATCTVHGYKEHVHLLGAIGLQLAMPLFDTKLAGYLVEPDFHASNLDKAFTHFLKISLDEKPEVEQGALDFGGDGKDEPHTLTKEETILRRVESVRLLAAHLESLIEERKQFNLLRVIEMPTSTVLSGMEDQGAKVDLERLRTMGDQFEAEAQQAEAIAWDRAGAKVNLQSPKQLQKILFEDMGLKPVQRTKRGSYSTNAASLQRLYVSSVGNERANDFLGALLKHRETNKLKQIVNSLMESVNPNDGRIHTTFEQTVAATGRLSSVDPNLQNIPNKNAAGREIRSAFVPGEGFESLLSCDYSQVELRIMADLSGDEALIEAFKSGTDFHKYVASLVYGIGVDEVSSDQRSHVKAMSYGLAYGLSTYGLAQQLDVSPAEADVLKSQYFSTFGKVHDYLESLVEDARVKGYTETIFGRRRYFPGLKSKRRPTRDAAERAALNAPIQGSAADIMKIAMIKAQHTMSEAGCRSRIVLQIHDELVVEIAAGEEKQVAALVKEAMEHAVRLAVPLDVSTGIGGDWQQAAH
ncbi:DNA polymerase I [Bifidobacterium xylocopae]|uniref:DNA polymerase I n=1 Tax=Bifidobacterium xylocopae TaxID=2493119 RepID=A0A366KFY3_9BIFI|nr:DNA polymerase I [Bifidobacterium xylocopae]RBQ00089.1 DNA polymerase I [Bifidobacterium xylocopae]